MCEKFDDVFADVVRLGHDVDVVKAEIRQTQAREEFEGFVELVIRRRLIERAAVPGAAEGAGAENIEPVPVEGMPVAHRHAQLLFHGLAERPRDSCRSSDRPAGLWIAGLRRLIGAMSPKYERFKMLSPEMSL